MNPTNVASADGRAAASRGVQGMQGTSDFSALLSGGEQLPPDDHAADADSGEGSDPSNPNS